MMPHFFHLSKIARTTVKRQRGTNNREALFRVMVTAKRRRIGHSILFAGWIRKIVNPHDKSPWHLPSSLEAVVQGRPHFSMIATTYTNVSISVSFFFVFVCFRIRDRNMWVSPLPYRTLARSDPMMHVTGQYHSARPYIPVNGIPNFDPTQLPYWDIYQREGTAETIKVGGTMAGEFVAGLSGGQRKLLLFELVRQRVARQSEDLLIALDGKKPILGVSRKERGITIVLLTVAICQNPLPASQMTLSPLLYSA